MAGKDTIGVFNNTQRIIKLKGQVPVKNKKDRGNPKRFSTLLEPGILTFVPKAFWPIYKRNFVTQALLDTEQLLVNRQPTKSVNKTLRVKPDPQAAALLALENNGKSSEEDSESETVDE